MEQSTSETLTLTAQEHFERQWNLCILQYVQQHRHYTNTRLFSFLALLNAYVPESYLLMSECQQILGPPDPIHGGPPFEERMAPFTDFINTSSPRPGHVCMIDQMVAQRAVELLADLEIYRSVTVKKFMTSLCGREATPHTIQFIKDLLTKREKGKKGKEKFSRLIEDIRRKEYSHFAVSVLKFASDKFRKNPIFPQTISRFHYAKRYPDFDKAEEWAKKAIQRAPGNSYVADTLGQIYKNLLKKAWNRVDIIKMAEQAFRAFKDVENKAEREEGPEMEDAAGTVSISDSFNNRGLFGFIEVAKITFEKLSARHRRRFIQSKKLEVEAKFEFFEWYLTYSKPDMTTFEPDYFWRVVALCYEHYTGRTAAESTSFPALLDCLNHGLITSKGRRAGSQENEKTASDLEAIQEDLKTSYEADVADVKEAEMYILSNVILSNRMPDSPQLTPVRELQTIILRFLGAVDRPTNPEFYLLVLLLFWPEEQPQAVQEEEDEEVEQKATEDDGSEDKTWEDKDDNEEEERRGAPAQPPLEPMPDLDLQKYVTFMGEAFKGCRYAKYLRGRYLLPLFFLGKGPGLSKWIHKSRLDAIVERNVDADPAERNERINDMWISGKVWQVPEIQDVLLPVRVEPCHSVMMPQEHEEQEVFVWAGEKKIKVEVKLDAPVLNPKRFYLGFNIQGPVLFKVGVPQASG